MKEKKAKKKQTPVVPSNTPIIVLLIVVIGLGIYIIFTQYGTELRMLLPKSDKEPIAEITSQPTPIPSISPTPYPIEKGRKEYTFTWGDGTTVPKMTSMIVDPHDPQPGTKQTVTATFTHTSAISGVSMVLSTDTQKNTFPMTLQSGDGTNGTWTGSWTIPESHDYTYILTPMVKADGKDIPYKSVIREVQQ